MVGAEPSAVCLTLIIQFGLVTIIFQTVFSTRSFFIDCWHSNGIDLLIITRNFFGERTCKLAVLGGSEKHICTSRMLRIRLGKNAHTPSHPRRRLSRVRYNFHIDNLNIYIQYSYIHIFVKVENEQRRKQYFWDPVLYSFCLRKDVYVCASVSGSVFYSCLSRFFF